MTFECVAVMFLAIGVCPSVEALTLDTFTLLQAADARPDEDSSWSLDHPADLGEEFEPTNVDNMLSPGSSARGFARSGGDLAGLEGALVEADTFLEHVMRSLIEPGDELAVADETGLPAEEDLESDADAKAPTSPQRHWNGTAKKGMRMMIEIKKLSKGTRLYVKFAKGCRPSPGRVMVNCIFKLGERIKYKWAFQSNDTLEEGDSMDFAVTPKIMGRYNKPTLLWERTYRNSCPACGTVCKRKTGNVKIHTPLKPCGTPMDLGINTEYKVPKDLPSVSFMSTVKSRKKDGTINAEIKILWDIGPMARLEKLVQKAQEKNLASLA